MKQYNVQMIRDFLDQILWELRTHHLENTTQGTVLHPELLEQLRPFMSRYGSALLRSQVLVKDDARLTDDQVQAALDFVHTEMAALRQRQLSQLEALRPLFEEALDCATRRGVTEQRIPISHLVPQVSDDDSDAPQAE